MNQTQQKTNNFNDIKEEYKKEVTEGIEEEEIHKFNRARLWEQRKKLQKLCRENGIHKGYRKRFKNLIRQGRDPDEAMKITLIKKNQRYDYLRKIPVTRETIDIEMYCRVHNLKGKYKTYFRKMLKQGFEPEDAKRKTLDYHGDPIQLITTPYNSVMPQTSSHNEQQQQQNDGNNRTTWRRDAETTETKNNSLSVFSLAVLPNKFPHERLSKADLNDLENDIIEEVGRGWEAELLFEGIHFGAGRLIVNCKNLDTVQWLYHVVPQLHKWEGKKKLMVCKEDELPKSIVSIYLKNSAGQDLEKTMELIKCQNRGLNMQEWEVLSCKNVNKELELKVSIDDDSYNRIKINCNVIQYKSGTAPVQLSSYNKKT